MFGVELLKRGLVTDRASILIEEFDEALSAARTLAMTVPEKPDRFRLLNKEGAELGAFAVGGDEREANICAGISEPS